jgi:DNA-binding XRE family transcriptional regulator
MPGEAIHERGYSQGKVAEYRDRYGDVREIHKTRHGLVTVRNSSTVPMELNGAVGHLVGLRIRAARIEAGLSMSQLCRRAGIVTTFPKQRMHEIENGSRKYGIRFGTLYAIALVLDKEPGWFLPPMANVLMDSGVEFKSVPHLDVK